jgi:surfactin synthase thioesterase subunit
MMQHQLKLLKKLKYKLLKRWTLWALMELKLVSKQHLKGHHFFFEKQKKDFLVLIHNKSFEYLIN